MAAGGLADFFHLVVSIDGQCDVYHPAGHELGAGEQRHFRAHPPPKHLMEEIDISTVYFEAV